MDRGPGARRGRVRHPDPPADAPSYLVSTLPAPAAVRAEADLRLAGPARGAVGLVAAYRTRGDHVVAWLDAARGALVTDVLVAGRSTGVRATPLPETFRFDTWHHVAVEVGRGRIHVEVTESQLSDPVARQDRALPTGAGGAGSVGVVALGAPADADNVGAARLHEPVRGAFPPPSTGPVDPRYGDEFDDGVAPGSAGDPGPWEWARGPQGREAAGRFRWPTGGGELYGAGGNAPVLVRPAPAGAYAVDTKLTFAGDGAPFQQAGLLLYAGDDEYVKLVHVATRGGETARTEFAMEGTTASGDVRYGANFVGPPARTMWLRLSHRLGRARGARRDQPGRPVVGVGSHVDPAGHRRARIGLLSANSPGARATFHYVRVHRP